jgi:hypothetical protein
MYAFLRVMQVVILPLLRRTSYDIALNIFEKLVLLIM